MQLQGKHLRKVWFIRLAGPKQPRWGGGKGPWGAAAEGRAAMGPAPAEQHSAVLRCCCCPPPPPPTPSHLHSTLGPVRCLRRETVEVSNDYGVLPMLLRDEQ